MKQNMPKSEKEHVVKNAHEQDGEVPPSYECILTVKCSQGYSPSRYYYSSCLKGITSHLMVADVTSCGRYHTAASNDIFGFYDV